VRGNLEIKGVEGPANEIRAAFCRCGASKYKPFCDGSHDKLPFKDSGKGKPGNIDESLSSGQLKINPVIDGPVMINGPVEIYGADGELLLRGERAALCRCGASANKPFCDGSHMGIGFKSDSN
ncbi:MAG: hypothetical protein AMS22_12400, partial [Thiotrichales bacterium SG8_50]